MRAALYARVSTPEQSVEPQLRDLRAYAAARGLGIVREFSDVGVSGAKRSRPALDALMTAARRREFDTVIVHRFDRFARSTRHLVDALGTFRSLGIEFVSYSENIDTSTPIGEAMFSIIAAMAQLERDLISERVKMGIRNARAKGKRIGRKPLANYGAAELIQCRELRRAGVSIRVIASQTGVPRSTVARNVKKALTDL